jgi:endogenous inhibitor of DNA gyrase (YacG/DUF329 family)
MTVEVYCAAACGTRVVLDTLRRVPVVCSDRCRSDLDAILAQARATEMHQQAVAS